VLRSRSPFIIIVLILLSFACSFGKEAFSEKAMPTAAEAQIISKAKCGDDVCDGPENQTNCPADCDQSTALITAQITATSQAQAEAIQTPQAAATQTDTESIQPLNFFYAIHTHANGDYLPYTSPGMKEIDPMVAENMIAAIEGIQAVLDRHQVKGTWELVYGTAKGLCEIGGEQNLLLELQNDGHEIATHAHQVGDTPLVTEILRDDCGIEPNTASAFILYADKAEQGKEQQAVSDAIQLGVDLGLHTGTVNFSPGGDKNPFTSICNQQIGVGNDMWQQTGNLLFPWRPDYLNNNICADNHAGEMVFVDHVSIEWTIAPNGKKVDQLGQMDFMRLQKQFDAALNYMLINRPERTTAWGFVTHITEYSPGEGTEAPPNPESLAALDAFLSYVEEQADQGLVIFATASQIAGKVRSK